MSRDSAMALATGSPLPAIPSETPSGTEVIPQSQTPAQEQLASTPFTQLANKEAEIVRQRAEIKKERERIESEKEQIRGIKTQYDEYQATKAKDPVAALKLLGFTEADIINFIAAEQPEVLTAEQKAIKAAELAAETRIKAFEEAQAKRLKDEQVAQDKGLIDSYRQDVDKVIKADPDQFEYCQYHGSAANELIYEYVKQVAVDHGEAISPLEAAKEIEKYYEEQDKAMNTLKKRGFKPETPASQSEGNAITQRSRTITPGFPKEQQPNPTITKSRTLHNGATATMASTRARQSETREQKRERLMDMLRNGKLAK